MEAYGIYDRGSKRLEVYARCHGAEEVLRITWETWSNEEPGWDVLGPHMAALRFFDGGVATE